MHCRLYLLTTLIWAFSASFAIRANAQSLYSWPQFVEDYTAYVLEMEDEAADNDDAYGVMRYDWLDELDEIAHHPIDINHADRSDLEALHFLSDEQIDSLLSRRDRYCGGFRSLGELMTVRQLSYRDRAWLSLLLRFDPDTLVRVKYPSSDNPQPSAHRRSLPTDHNRWKDGTHEVIGTLNLPLYRRAGFYDYTASNYASKMFLGQRFGHSLRYRYNWRHRLRYGVSVQQDVAEPFASHGAYPWDYQSAHFYYRSDPERYSFADGNLLRFNGHRTEHSGQNRTMTVSRYEWALGDYHLTMGQGLVMGSNGWNALSGVYRAVRSETTNLRPNTGNDESRFLRGAAGTLRLGRRAQWVATAFASWRQLDGTVKSMSAKNAYDPHLSDTLTAWKTDGMHRTLQEVNKRNVAQQILAGGRVAYQTSWINIGVLGAWSHYDKVYSPAPRTYNRYYFRGQDAGACSVDYSLLRRRWSLQGEVALDRSAAYAVTTTLQIQPLTALTFVLQERSFAHDFVTPYGHTFQSNSQLQNEHALLLGIRYAGFRRLELSATVDASLHPQPVYLADTLSHRLSASAQVIYRASTSWNHNFCYTLKSRQQNVTGYKDISDNQGVLLSWRTTQHLRWQSSWSMPRLSLTFGADGACYYAQATRYDKKADAILGAGSTFGGLLFVRASATPHRLLRCSAVLAGFLTEDYNTRCYAYFPQLQGNISMPACNGQGVVATVMTEYTLWRQLLIALHYSVITYFDRTVISSGINRIDSRMKHDLSLQLRWFF